MSVQRGGDGGSIEFDPEDVEHQHVMSNFKRADAQADEANDIMYWENALEWEPLDGDLRRGDVAMLLGATIHGVSVNIANQSSKQVQAQLNVSHEVSLDDDPHFTFRDGPRNMEVKKTITNDGGQAGEGTEGIDVRANSQGGDPVIFASRLDHTSGFNDSTNGAAAGHEYDDGDPSGVYVDFIDRFGGPIPMTKEDTVNEHILANEDGFDGTNSLAWSQRAVYSLHWYVFEGEEPSYPEFFKND